MLLHLFASPSIPSVRFTAFDVPSNTSIANGIYNHTGKVKYVFYKRYIYVSVPIFSTFVMYNTNATENINNPIILYSGFSPSVFFLKLTF